MRLNVSRPDMRPAPTPASRLLGSLNLKLANEIEYGGKHPGSQNYQAQIDCQDEELLQEGLAF